MPDTALAVAFVEAGYEPPWSRLLAIAVEAWAKWPGQDAGGARRDFVIGRLQGEMSWALITTFQPSLRVQAIGWLLNRAAEEIKDQRDAGKPAGGGHPTAGTHAPPAPASNAGQPAGDRQINTDAQASFAVTPSSDTLGHSRDDPQTRLAESRSGSADMPSKTKTTTPAAPNLTVLANKQRAAAEATARVGLRLCRLDTVTVDGKPIGDCTVAEVKTWAERRSADQRSAGRDARFALALVANLPSGAVIRDWWKSGEEVDTIYDRAEAEHAA